MAKLPPRPQGQKQKVGSVRRGEIYLCFFDPTVGHEIKKTRPALVIQNDIGNRYSPLTIVAAITSTVSAVPYPVEVVLEPTTGNGLDGQSSIRLDQIRTVDRQRLVRRLGVADSATMARVDEAIKISLGLIRIEER
jgi:mRNA interferase MazF